MNRLILTGACALFFVGCTAKVETPSGTGTMPAAAVATDASAKFELGKTI